MDFGYIFYVDGIISINLVACKIFVVKMFCHYANNTLQKKHYSYIR